MVIIFLDNGVIDMGEEYFSFFKYILSPCVPIFLFKGCIKKFASIKAQHLPLKEPYTFLFSFFPLLSALPGALPSYQDVVLSDDYPFPVWCWSDWWSSEWLRHWDLVTVSSLEINLSTSPPNAVLLLMIAVMGPFMHGPPADQWLWVFGCYFQSCHPI